ncbi:MAG TPA: hypothetical protein VNB30_12910 [Rhizomicrobium sp.]|jgi:hypothetical protein|nr:hypothetical protein [Rhizomicrobium sp.]
MHLSADDLYRIASDLAEEHGAAAMDYARRAVVSFEAEGAIDRARFWLTVCVFLDDIVERRLDPSRQITLH